MAHRNALLGLLSAFLIGAQAAPSSKDFADDARSIERLINEDYAYLERLPGSRMPISEKLRLEAASVSNRQELTRYAERALTVLADHHAITGSSLADSWALVPSYSDIWVEHSAGKFRITAVRKDTPAERAGVKPGDELVRIEDVPTQAAVSAFWADLGAPGGGERDSYAARVLAAGRRNKERRITVSSARAGSRSLVLQSLYSHAQPDRPVIDVKKNQGETVLKFNDSLGNDATIGAFDSAMAEVGAGQKLIIDMTDTPGGGNASVARAILGWFVQKPSFYQVHSLPAEERQSGIARQWVEQVLPRRGKYYGQKVEVRVGRWTGSMGEGLAVAFDALGHRVAGDRMAGLLGAIYDYRLEKTGFLIKFPVEKLYHVNGTPRESFRPHPPRL